ncbi:MAG TPA: PaaX family transcriptional regulator C-terminal domain-containing protein [Micrococcaceae bacterium]|nr:PaaX family transcriptional regulator C-terminal domain-containing protein [Micrococcaceae bacterium]
MSRPAPKVLQQQLIVTLYGLYGKDNADSFPVSSLVAMLSEVDVEEQAARSTVSRLKSKGVLLREKIDGITRYRLSDAVLDIFHADDQRIFAPERSRLDDPWSLVVFSVPEAERNRRYELRSELISLGFGFVASGVAIAPSTVMEQAMQRLAERQLDHYVEYFSGDYLKDGDMRGRVADWWDLDQLDRQYMEFIELYTGPALEYAQDGSRVDGREAFAVYVPMLTLWRKFPYRDPNLPLEYLPPEWKAPRAKQTFLTLHRVLAAPAAAYAEGLLKAER